MRKSKKKLLAMLLAGTMVFGMLPSNAFANNEQDLTSTVVDEPVTTDDSTKLEEEGDTNQGTTEVETPVEEANPEEAETENKTEEALPEGDANTEVAVDLSLEEIKLQKTEEIKAGEKYIIVYDNKKAISTGKDNIIAVPIEVEGDTVKTEITKNMIWTVDDKGNLTTEWGKYLTADLGLQEKVEEGQFFKFDKKNVSYEENEVNTYLTYNEEKNKWSFEEKENEAVTYYNVVGPVETLKELTEEELDKIEEAKETELPQEDEVSNEVIEKTEVEEDEITEGVNDEVVDDLEEDIPTTFVSGNITYVLDTDGVDSGSEYLIVAQSENDYYALKNNNGSIATSNKLTVNGTNVTDIADASLWTITRSNSNYKIKNGDYYLRILNGDSSFGLNLNTTNSNNGLVIGRSGSNYRISDSYSTGNWQNRKTYYSLLQFSGSVWSNTTGNNSLANTYSIQLYKKVEKVSVTVKYYLNGTELENIRINTTENKNSTYNILKPSEFNGYSFQKILVNGTPQNSEINRVTITEDTIIEYYYYNPYAADDKLYPDDTADGGQYPQYPNEGAVKIDKNATSNDFRGTGVTKVELGVTGVPVKKGVDVVLLFDVSTSMKESVSSTDSTSKLVAAKDAASDFIDSVLGDNADGTKSNNRLALVTFAGWNNEAGNEVLYGLKNANSKDEIKSTISSIDNTYSGTDYDYAFEKANVILGTADPNRETYIVFMTDGAPSEYSGYRFGQDNFVRNVNNSLLTGAEDSKSSGAKVYSIGFGLTNASTNSNNGFTPAEAKAILQKISSGDRYYVSADSQDEINTAFNNIAMQIRKAGTNAMVTDKLGPAFNLQTSSTIPKNENGTITTKPLGFNPVIEVLEYDLYTKTDIGTVVDGVTITSNHIGTRKPGNPTVVERITFSADGATATSSLKGTDNIIDSNGDIIAEKFVYDSSEETFTWSIGDITQKGIALSYYAYLEGSQEGNRTDGLYDTNQYAKLNYDNYLGTPSEKVFEKPKMPWGAAQVTYEFYLVNAEGKPVNAKGVEVPFEYRIKISDPIAIKFNWNNGTTITGEVVAKDLVPAGYTLHIQDAKYTVNAKSSGKGEYTIAGTIPSNSQQSTKLAGEHDEGFTYSSVAFGVVYSAKLNPDTIVLDYGKSVNIDVIKNDLTQDAKLYSVAKKEGTDLGGVIIGSGQDTDGVNFTGNTATDKNGRAEVIDNNVVKYTPTRMMDSIDKFYYSAEVKTIDTDGKETTFYQYEELTVMPATTVYYEDNFAQGEVSGGGIEFIGEWKTVNDEGKTVEGGINPDKDDVQDNGTVNKDEHPYGSDNSYKDNNKFSNGSARLIKGNGTSETSASFIFKGTGFDLISRTNTSTGSIIVTISKKTGVNDNGKSVYKQVKKTIVNNQYQSGDLYQIPVINFSGSYEEYKVDIIVGNTDFYFDAVRVYNPLGLSATDNCDFEDAYRQYLADGEANAQIQEIRNILLDSGDFSAGKQVTGAVFVDIDENVTDIGIYDNKGPNNEVYLDKGQSIAFKVITTGDPRTIQLGIKSPNGTNSKVVIDGKSENLNINTATDMYYDITDAIQFTVNNDGSKEGIVVITNDGSSGSIISITNLKITYGSAGQTSSIVSDLETVRYANMVNYIRSTVKSDDVNNDGVVDILDLANVGINNNEEVKLGVSYDIYKFDVNGDGVIDMSDLEFYKETLDRY